MDDTLFSFIFGDEIFIRK